MHKGNYAQRLADALTQLNKTSTTVYAPNGFCAVKPDADGWDVGPLVVGLTEGP